MDETKCQEKINSLHKARSILQEDRGNNKLKWRQAIFEIEAEITKLENEKRNPIGR